MKGGQKPADEAECWDAGGCASYRTGTPDGLARVSAIDESTCEGFRGCQAGASCAAATQLAVSAGQAQPQSCRSTSRAETLPFSTPFCATKTTLKRDGLDESFAAGESRHASPNAQGRADADMELLRRG